MAIAVPVFAAGILPSVQNDWFGTALITSGVMATTSDIIEKVADKILLPFFSKNANSSAKFVGKTISVISEIAVPIILSQKIANYFNSNIGKSCYDAVISITRELTHVRLFHTTMIVGITIVAIWTIAAPFLGENAPLNTYDATKPHPLESTYAPFAHYDTKEFVLTVLKNQGVETDLTREDLIDALANPINGLIEHYGFMKLNLRSLTPELCEKDLSTDVKWGILKTGFYHKVIKDGKVSDQVFTYNLKNKNPSALEDEIREDLGNYNVPLPPRIYP